jgi:hypothetical protein
MFFSEKRGNDGQNFAGTTKPLGKPEVNNISYCITT